MLLYSFLASTAFPCRYGRAVTCRSVMVTAKSGKHNLLHNDFFYPHWVHTAAKVWQTTVVSDWIKNPSNCTRTEVSQGTKRETSKNNPFFISHTQELLFCLAMGGEPSKPNWDLDFHGSGSICLSLYLKRQTRGRWTKAIGAELVRKMSWVATLGKKYKKRTERETVREMERQMKGGKALAMRTDAEQFLFTHENH